MLSSSTLTPARVFSVAQGSEARGVAVYGGEVFVADNSHIAIFSRAGEWLRNITPRDFYAPTGERFRGGFPVGVAVAHGRVFVAEEDCGRCQVLTTDGLHIQSITFGTHSRGLHSLSGIAVHPTRLEVYVTSLSVHVLAVRDKQGEEECDDASESESEGEDEQMESEGEGEDEEGEDEEM